ncbi:pre-rRNA processing protein [Ascosphaera aggregata]|nr:pre-rRNA processing protein [Ascosphaera aggregata]
MSSFFTLPASQKKRKRDDASTAHATRKRGLKARDERKAAIVAAPAHKKKLLKAASDSEIDDDDIESDVDSVAEEEEEQGSSSEDETAADRRLRLAERYLENVREEVQNVGFDAAEIDRDLIAERLKEDVDEFKGRVFRQIAEQISFSTPTHTFFRADTQSTTSVAIHPPYVYTVSKDKTLIKWELVTPTEEISKSNTKSKRLERRKPRKVKFVRGLQPTENGEKHGHTAGILTVAVSPSGQFVATGGADKRIIVWDAETLVPLRTFSQHRDAISSLSFSRAISSMSSGEQLFSASFDRTIKTWSLSPGAHAYVETLFGHQDHVLSVDAMTIDQCVSVGARDRTARLWKVVDETQLIFRGGASKNVTSAEGSIDCVAVVPPSHFVTGSDNGAISLWNINKKKPLFTVGEAHGFDDLPPPEDLSSEKDPSVAERVTKALKPSARWITALATLPGTDIVLSGSWDGHIRAWQISEDKKRLRALGPVGGNINAPLIKGVVNDIAVFERRNRESSRSVVPVKEKMVKVAASRTERKGLCIVAAVGKECRLGRWKSFNSQRIDGEPAGRNGAIVLEVPFLAHTISHSDEKA